MEYLKLFVPIDPASAINDTKFEKEFPSLPHSSYEWERMYCSFVRTGDVAGARRFMDQIAQKYPNPDAFLFGGDYSITGNNVADTETGLNQLNALVSSKFSNLAPEDRYYIQGNHDYHGNALIKETGAYETEHYLIYVLNHKDYSAVGAAKLKHFFEQNKDCDKPIFVLSHCGIHYNARGHLNCSDTLYNVLDDAGESGLNIIVLFGHNHSGIFDDYLGNSAIYLPKGSNFAVSNPKGGYTMDTADFTYVNYGYIGFTTSSSKSCYHQTMTVFEITDDEVIVYRYDQNGIHELRAAGHRTYNDDPDAYDRIESGAVIPIRSVATVVQADVPEQKSTPS